MKMGDVVKNAPNSLIWAVVVSFLGILATFAIMSISGSDTETLWVFINRLFNIAGAVFGGGAFIVAGAAAKSSANAERQTNGELDAKIEQAIRRANETR